MDNVLETNGIALTVFGGAVPELAPEDLPEGASPFSQDCDFNPGSVFSRAGRVNQVTYQNLVVDHIAGSGKSIPGQFAPNEVAWLNPNAITQNSPPTYAQALLNQGVNISNILQFKQVMVNTSGTTFTAAFDSPVTAGSCVFIALFIHDPNGVAEGVNCTACIDNKSQNADHIVANITTPNNTDVAFSILYKSATGGNQTYTFTIRTNAAGTVTASNYAYCLCEVIGTANALGADPSDQLVAITYSGGPGASQSTVATVTTAQPNELFLGVVQSSAATWNGFFMPGTYWSGSGPATMRVVQEIDSSSGNYQQQALVGENIPSNPGTTLGITNTGPTTGINWIGAWVTLKMTNTNAAGKQGLLPGVDVVTTNTVAPGTTIILPQITTSSANEFIFWVAAYNNNFGYPTIVPPVGYVGADTGGGNGAMYGTFAPTAGSYGPFTALVPGGGSTASVSAAFAIPAVGIGGPNILQESGNASIGVGAINLGWTRAVTPGSTILVFGNVGFANPFSGFTVTDSVGDAFTPVTTVSAPNGVGSTVGLLVYICQNAIGGNTDVTIHSTVSQGGGAVAIEIAGGQVAIQPTPHSQILQASNFALNIPSTTPVLGMQIEIAGHQTSLDPSATLTVSIPSSPAGTPAYTTQLPAADAQIALGNQFSNQGFLPFITPANLANISVNIVANSPNFVPVTFDIYAVRLRVFLGPGPPANFNWIHTYEQTDAEIDTLALDANGILWDEDVDLNPTVLNSIFTSILPNTFAKGVTFNDIEYVAFSNLQNGTDCPRQWNGTNLDRVSQVGPGDKPSIASSGGSGGGTTAIQNTTQQAKTMLRRIAWGASANVMNDSTPGNLLICFGEGRTGANIYQSLPPYTNVFGAGTTVVLSGIPVPFPKKDGGSVPFNINGSYTINSVTTGIVGGAESCPVFLIPSPTTTYAYSADFGSAGPPPTSNWFYQSCIATLTTQVPLPNVGAGSTITVTGTGGSPPTGYDGTWLVLTAPNASSMTINSAILVGQVATFSFTLAPGSNLPQAGQTVTITNVLNGYGHGTDPNVFNVTASITAVSGANFSVNIAKPDVPVLQPQVPPAAANVGGTIFTFDAGAIVNSGNPVSGGTIVGQGQVATGVRKVCYSFLTRSGYITQPSPIATFNVTSGSGSITVTGLSTGPSNVVARIVSFTGANGGNFFYIPQNVDLLIGGVLQHNTATIVNDNSTTTATFSFTDAVLLSATAIDIPGNNLFNTIELGSSRGLLTYSSRMVAWGEQAKVTNFRNLSFDGGYSGVTIQGANTTQPGGWTIDGTAGGGGSLSLGSPVFGWSYQISNSSGITQTTYGMITQGAWQDEFGVPIIQASTLYSVRICALCQPQPQGGGNLVVDLSSPTTGVLGTFSVPLASMTTTMQIYTGTLLTNILQPVPQDLQLRIWAQNIANGAQILIDRVEPFPTLTPANTLAFKMSYANNQEAFDLTTGVCGPAQNTQPLNGGMELFDLLYALKERSWFSTFDNGVTEPNRWNWKEVSNKVGAVGQNAYDWGEGWALTADRQGVHFFEGGEPQKISQEIQPLWDMINWQFGYTIWLRNDPEQKRFTVGIPIPTPNIYMPEFPANANPTSPNCILMCNYRELNTGAALAATSPIRSTYTGRLMSPEPARKWSFWNVSCPYSDFISRNNNQWPQWFCTGYADNKLFALQASVLSDDGNAINSFWISYGFVKPEMADAKGLGLFRMEFPYFTVLATGAGQLNTYVYPESPFNRPYVLDPQTLPATTQGDLEIGVNIKGQRFFVRVGTNAVGAGYRVSKMIVPLMPDTWSPIRGTNVITA